MQALLFFSLWAIAAFWDQLQSQWTNLYQKVAARKRGLRRYAANLYQCYPWMVCIALTCSSWLRVRHICIAEKVSLFQTPGRGRSFSSSFLATSIFCAWTLFSFRRREDCHNGIRRYMARVSSSCEGIVSNLKQKENLVASNVHHLSARELVL